jgi:hypothetical protein
MASVRGETIQIGNEEKGGGMVFVLVVNCW